MNLFKSAKKLLEAIEENDTATAMTYLTDEKHVASWNKEVLKKKFVTLLGAAARKNNVEILAHLITHGANIDEKNGIGTTALFSACVTNNTDAALFLLRKGASVKHEPKDGDCDDYYYDHAYYDYRYDDEKYYGSPLHVAMLHSNQELIHALVSQGAGMDQTGFIHLCRKPELWTSYQTLAQHGMDIRDLPHFSTNAVKWAIGGSNKNMVQELLRKGATFSGNDFLCLVQNPDSDELYELIAAMGKIPKELGIHAGDILIAAMRHKSPVLGKLLNNGHNIDAQDVNGDTLMHAAVRDCDVASVQELIKRHASTDISNRSGETAWTMAARLAEETEWKSNERKIKTILKEYRDGLINKNTWEIDGAQATHVSDIKASEKRITDIFNFSDKQRLTIIDDLSGRMQQTALRENFDTVPESVLRNAFNAYRDSGGKMPEEDALTVFASKQPAFFKTAPRLPNGEQQ